MSRGDSPRDSQGSRCDFNVYFLATREITAVCVCCWAGMSIRRCNRELGSARPPGSAPPLPELLPNLHQGLHLARTGKPAVNQPAIFMRTVIKSPHSLGTQVRQTLAESLQLVGSQDIGLLIIIRTPCHGEAMVACSPFVRYRIAWNFSRPSERSRSIPNQRVAPSGESKP